jgi:hypothetical protein
MQIIDGVGLWPQQLVTSLIITYLATNSSDVRSRTAQLELYRPIRARGTDAEVLCAHSNRCSVRPKTRPPFIQQVPGSSPGRNKSYRALKFLVG